MADSLIEDEILIALLEEHNNVVVLTHGMFRKVTGVQGSSKAVKRALGSLIKRGIVIRHRPEPQRPSDTERPITFWLNPERARYREPSQPTG